MTHINFTRRPLSHLSPHLPSLSYLNSTQYHPHPLKTHSKFFLHGFRSQPAYLLRLLKASAAIPSHPLTTSIHAHILKSGFHNDTVVSTALISALSLCSDIDNARYLFDQMPNRDTAAWNAMLSAYLRNGLVKQSLLLFCRMASCGTMPNSRTLSVLLQACGTLEDNRRQGRCVHAYLYKHPELADTFLWNSLLVYYNTTNDLNASEMLFERMGTRDVVSWNAMMAGYTRAGLPHRALEVFCSLRVEGLPPDIVTIETAVQACVHIGETAIENGETIHGLLVRLGFAMDVYINNSLLLMYCKCGRMELAESLFDHMPAKNIVSWNILLSGYIRIRNAEKAMVLFNCVRSVESEISSDLIVSALQAARLTGQSIQVMRVHCLIIVMRFDSDVFVSSSLIAAYGDTMEVGLGRRCLDCAQAERIAAVVCWNTMLSVYLRHGYYSEAVELVRQMQFKACVLDAVTLVNTLSVCIQWQDLEMGKAVHGYIIRNQFESDVFLTTPLLELYTRCRQLSAACLLFSNMSHRNIVSWNTMIHGCLQNGFPRVSLQLFHRMMQHEGLVPDATSVVGLVEAIALRGHGTEKDYIHEYVVTHGLVDNEFVANSLISMHARFRDLKKAHMVFDKVKNPSLVTWNTMIAEYSNCQAGMAISVFHWMKFNNVAPDSVTLLCLLRACAGIGSVNCVSWAHTVACKAGCESDLFVGTSLVDVYAKCGELSMARSFFDKMTCKTSISWNSMIQGYGMHGDAEEASRLFSEMQKTGLYPTVVTFLVLISACSHAGNVEKGQHYFDLMTRAYPFLVREEHVSSFIDLLARRGLVKVAYDFLEKLPMDHGLCTWGALLGACRVHGNLELGLAAAERLFELDPGHCGYSFLLSNMCAEAGLWMNASIVRHNFDKMGLKKVQAWSMVESFS